MQELRFKITKDVEAFADRLNTLNQYMQTKAFYELDREIKSGLYDQARLLLNLVEHTGALAERLEVKLDLPTFKPKQQRPEPQKLEPYKPFEPWFPFYREPYQWEPRYPYTERDFRTYQTTIIKIGSVKELC